MRTTVDLTEVPYRAVKAMARERGDSMGKVISELILRGAHEPPVVMGKLRMVDRWPVVSYGKRVSSEDVRDLLAEDA